MLTKIKDYINLDWMKKEDPSYNKAIDDVKKLEFYPEHILELIKKEEPELLESEVKK